MVENEYYSQEARGPYEEHDLGDFELAEGGTLRGSTLAYVTHGQLNEAKGNAILMPTWHSGTSKTMEGVYVGSEFREIESIDGHLGLFGFDADAIAQIDERLSDLLAMPAGA